MFETIRKGLKRLKRDSVLGGRKCIAYCIGYGKSGTHSVANIARGCLRAEHEPEAGPTIELILRRYSGELSEEDLRGELRNRDRRLMLELESSCLLIHFIDELTELHVDAKFIVTIRDPIETLESSYNHMLGIGVGKFRRYDDWKYGSDQKNYNAIENRVLEGLDLPSPRSILRAWVDHYRKTEEIPRDKVLFLRTEKISSSSELIGEFLGLDGLTEAEQETHVFSNPKKFNIVERFPDSYLEDCLGEEGRAIRARLLK